MDKRYETVDDMRQDISHNHDAKVDVNNELAGGDGVDLNAVGSNDIHTEHNSTTPSTSSKACLATTEGRDMGAVFKATDYAPPPTYDTRLDTNPDSAIYTDYQAPEGRIDIEGIEQNGFKFPMPDGDDLHDEARFLEGERRRRLQEEMEGMNNQAIEEREGNTLSIPEDDNSEQPEVNNTEQPEVNNTEQPEINSLDEDDDT